MIPLVIHNTDVLDPAGARQTTTYQGATESHIHAAISSSSSAFPAWSRTAPSHRRDLLRNVARLVHERSAALRETMHDETHTPPDWAQGNVTTAIELLEETAGLISEVVRGALPVTKGESVAMVVKEPVGVVLAIAPWNASLFLGFRAIVAALAAGNTVLFKGSDLSPKCHYLIACLFRDAGFPPGVLNFVLHRPEDAPALYELTINDPHVRKCNFTGSTNVGRIIASKAAYALKPVLLELGGKNFALMLDDARVEQAAEQIILGAVLNNGQICMSTDLVYVSDTLAAPLTTALINRLQPDKTTYRLITPTAKARLTELLADARSKGATIHQPTATASSTSSTNDPNNTTFPPTVIENVTPEMAFYSSEAFGPVVGLVRSPTESHALDLVSQMTSGHGFGLSAAIFTGAHFRALQIASEWRVGAVHVNSMTVHDEATLPHGGFGESGFGRFGGKWGVEEFLVERVIVLNP